MQKQTPAPYFTIPEVAAIRRVHPDTVRRAISDGQLKAYKFGRQIRIRPEDLAAWGSPVGQ